MDDMAGRARHDVVLVAHELVAAGLRLLLAADDRTRVVGAVEDPVKLLEVLARWQPDVCVLHRGSTTKPGIDDLTVLINSVVVGRQTPMLVLDEDCESELVVGALEAGAQAVLHPADVRRAFVPAVCAVAGGLS